MQIEKPKPALADPDQQEPVPSPIHELIEALTATGNYLTAASRMLDAQADLPQAVLLNVLEKGLGQFSRATEAVRQLSKSFRSLCD